MHTLFKCFIYVFFICAKSRTERKRNIFICLLLLSFEKLNRLSTKCHLVNFLSVFSSSSFSSFYLMQGYGLVYKYLMSICSLRLIVRRLVFSPWIFSFFIHSKFNGSRGMNVNPFVKNLLLKIHPHSNIHFVFFFWSWIRPYLYLHFAKTFFQFLFRIWFVAIQKVKKPNTISVWFTVELFLFRGLVSYYIKKLPNIQKTWKEANQFKREKKNFLESTGWEGGGGWFG